GMLIKKNIDNILLFLDEKKETYNPVALGQGFYHNITLYIHAIILIITEIMLDLTDLNLGGEIYRTKGHVTIHMSQNRMLLEVVQLMTLKIKIKNDANIVVRIMLNKAQYHLGSFTKARLSSINLPIFGARTLGELEVILRIWMFACYSFEDQG
ncbi:hypothetical protein ACJX0J_039985, partial [Zea mays]